MTTAHLAGSSRPSKHTSLAKLTVADVMTEQPLTIGRDQPLSVAHRMMRENRVRHLPVLEHGELVGVLTQRDLYFLETIAGVEIDSDKIDDAMSTDAYAVAPDARLEDVAAVMAEQRYGCAVVMERGRVAGIFTATDALRVIAGLIP
jgi:acetoin utilization protein AcuB